MEMINKKQPSEQNDNWTNYKIYVVECIKSLTENYDKIEKKITENQVENITVVYEIKTEFQKQLQELADLILKLQIRMGIVCSVLAVLSTIGVNVITYLIISFLNK